MTIMLMLMMMMMIIIIIIMAMSYFISIGSSALALECTRHCALVKSTALSRSNNKY